MDDLSISRISDRVQWGIDVPNDSSHKIYVWLDALVNYLTVAGYPNHENVWPATLHIIGKDILKFHCIYWPAFLMAADLPLPKRVLIHGHWLIDRQKMSKSSGNGVDPYDLMKKFGVDPIRYFLIRDGGISIDPEFTEDTIWRRYKHDLAGQLGNVIMRCSSRKINPNGDIPIEKSRLEFSEEELQILNKCNILAEECDDLIEQGLLPDYLDLVSDLVADLNKYWSTVEPWNFSKQNTIESRQKLQNVLYMSFELIRISC
jgi:methionyl-tRNA synthetase